VWFVMRHKGKPSPWPLVAAALLLAATAYGVRPQSTTSTLTTVARAQVILSERCMPCHATTPRFEGITAAPKGVVLETPAQLSGHAVNARAQLMSRAMPPGNLTNLTDAERAELVAWIDARGK